VVKFATIKYRLYLCNFKYHHVIHNQLVKHSSCNHVLPNNQ